jgi:DNA (cytosine-5)-methyltransferase 1
MKRTQHVAPGSVVDLFCGAGGLSHGFRQNGFRIAAGIDIDEQCRFPFESNNDAPFIRRSVADFSGDEIKALFIGRGPRIMVGCAPCQPFSSYNQKNEDPKWELLGKFADLIVAAKPDVVSMENVPRLLAFKAGVVFDSFVRRLRAAGYSVSHDVLFGPDYGLAQTRSRLVLLASRRGPIALPKPSHKKHRTVRDEIGRLRPLATGEVDRLDPLHRASKLSELNKKRILASVPGGTWRDWDEDLVAECHRVDTGQGYSSVYGRMEWDSPAPTITTQFFGFGNGRFGHPEQDRALSLREGAMLQGFPRDYRFVRPGEDVNFKAVGRLIGNAVPVKLAKAIAGAVLDHLDTREEVAA